MLCNALSNFNNIEVRFAAHLFLSFPLTICLEQTHRQVKLTRSINIFRSSPFSSYFVPSCLVTSPVGLYADARELDYEPPAFPIHFGSIQLHSVLSSPRFLFAIFLSSFSFLLFPLSRPNRFPPGENSYLISIMSQLQYIFVLVGGKANKIQCLEICASQV